MNLYKRVHRWIYLMSILFSRKQDSSRHLLLLYFTTLHYLKATQVLYRIMSRVKFVLYRLFPAFWKQLYLRKFTTSSLGDVRLLSDFTDFNLRFEDKDEIVKRANQIVSGEFNFLNHHQDFSKGIVWNCDSVSHLWRYQLQYCHYIWDLGVAYGMRSEDSYVTKFKELIDSWIDQNEFGMLDGWHPYTVSLRTVNWMYGWALFEPTLKKDNEFCNRFFSTLYLQCEFLSHNLEFQGCGNHLLSNIKTLIFGGLFFNEPKSQNWLKVGLGLLEKELEEQILPDGGHFERSPMYHLLVMKDLIEIAAVLEKNNHSVSEQLYGKIEEMTAFTKAMCAFDGCISLLNDSSYDLAPDSDMLLFMADCLLGKPLDESRVWTWPSLLMDVISCSAFNSSSKDTLSGFVALEDTGYYLMKSKRGTGMILDCGPVCPDYLPPHAHADTLSFEFWVGGEKMISDSGTYEYTAGEWRDYFRSTRAHNTVVVDGMDQSEVWGSFRVAKRAYPKGVTWIASDEAGYFSGSHDGYHRLSEPIGHQRRVVYLEDRFWFVLDEITGQGEHWVESFLHFHPETVVDLGKRDHFYVSRGEEVLNVYPIHCGQINVSLGQVEPVIQGWYSSEFGNKQARKTCSWVGKIKPPHYFGYLLIPGNCHTAQIKYTLGEIERYEIKSDQNAWIIEVDLKKSEIRIE
jgi:uncharacterized heparinase superfamily protein